MKYIITCKAKDGRRVERVCFSEFQAFTVINILHREGCKDFGVKELEG